MRNIIITLSSCLILAVTASAEATPRKPIRSVAQRTTTLQLDPAKGYTELVQERDEMTKRAVFHADPQAIDENGVMLFQAFGVAGDVKVERWRCVAVRDIAECLGTPVRIAYQQGEERMVLRMTIRHRETDEGGMLLAEAKLRTNPAVYVAKSK